MNKAGESVTTPIHRREGITAAEQYLKQLCDKTFLSLWSYSGVYRDQKDGKEVCDLLVVFGEHIIIFSDKSCLYPEGENADLNWKRWFKRAIHKSAEQLWGAERWIRNHPNRLFLDPACTQTFPIALPDLSKAIIHRVLVAHGSTELCKKILGGSGSLRIIPDIVGSMHYNSVAEDGRLFSVGQIDPKQGYVHVFDDITLDIVMNTLDTITDFVIYLTRKEKFILNGNLYCAEGEEDLLAYYLTHYDKDGEHDFIIPEPANTLYIKKDYWNNFINHPQRQKQLKENRPSYAWDYIIEQLNTNILKGTQFFKSYESVTQAEQGMRFLAREPRTRRRLLAKALYGLIKSPSLGRACTRVVVPSHEGDPFYVFLAAPPFHPYETYREARVSYLHAYCMATKLHYPEAQDIVGIATEPWGEAKLEFDVFSVDVRNITQEEQNHIKQVQKDFRFFSNVSVQRGSEPEYPVVSLSQFPGAIPPMKGRNRNMPCPCGSGKKFKKCCGK